jgi:proteasome accessory factor A
MQKRIYGIETEYGIIFTPEGRKTLPVEKAIRFLFEKLITTEHFLNVFLENGARFYQDTGCHPEYATPECASPRQVILFDKAGERILEDLQLYAEEKIGEERITGKLSIFKNNTDFVGNSYGCHENYLVDRDVDFYYLAEQLIPFLVTRQIYTGAGKVFQTQDGVWRALLRQPAGPAHLPEDLGHHDQRSFDHQHPRRAPRRPGKVPAAPRHRW